MARTQAVDYDEKRQSITQKAAQLFSDKGFAATSIADLARLCEVSKSLIYHYYSSKEAILHDVMNEHVDDLLAVLDDSISSDVAPAENLQHLTRELLRHYVGAASYQKVLLYELGSLPPDQQKEIIRKQRILVSAVEGLLRKIDLNEKNSTQELRVKVMLFFGMLNWTDNWLNSRGPISRDNIADMVTSTTISAL